MRELSLLGNMVQRLPDDFTRLTNLELLQLDGQNFDSIPADITEQGGKRILEYIRKMALADTTATLDLSGMRVQQLPAAVCMIMSLQHLFLHNNPIAKLPPMIVQLTNLKTLTLNVSIDLIYSCRVSSSFRPCHSLPDFSVTSPLFHQAHLAW